MDLFGPTSVRSINHETYCLVVTDDFSRFSWVFFLALKDETSRILKRFITEIEFCGLKGIKREFSVARTPQQNGVAERKNRTLIEAAKTMLANSLLPTVYWAKAVNTTCYVLNRVAFRHFRDAFSVVFGLSLTQGHRMLRVRTSSQVMLAIYIGQPPHKDPQMEYSKIVPQSEQKYRNFRKRDKVCTSRLERFLSGTMLMISSLPSYFAYGRHLEELHVTWAYLEKNGQDYGSTPTSIKNVSTVAGDDVTNTT
ncbi:putative ribonuclease H-like domain-containing protein [Tanacetum coccineum]